MHLHEVSLHLSELQQILQMLQWQVWSLHEDVSLLLHLVVQAGHRIHRITEKVDMVWKTQWGPYITWEKTEAQKYLPLHKVSCYGFVLISKQ